jgi:quercetin dioxygenase-like cupin family protein
MTTILRGAPPVERFDVFDVAQLTRGTPLESLVAADLVELAPRSTSEVHRHDRSSTVIHLLEGTAAVLVGETWHEVRAGDRVVIEPGAYHGFRSGSERVRFLSVQVPPILDESTGRLDLERQP